MNITFTVAKSTPNKTGGHVWKLSANETVRVFGVEKVIKRTYYIGGMTVAGVVGTQIVEDINRFEIKEYEFAHPETGEIMNLKWLRAKDALQRAKA
jgi:hypothetical protein